MRRIGLALVALAVAFAGATPDGRAALLNFTTTIDQAQELIRNGTVTGGMIPKIEGCIEVVEAGVEAVVIINGRVPHSVLLELLTDHGAGTLVGRRKPKTR